MMTSDSPRERARKSSQPAEEKELVQRLAAGDPDALSVLYDRYSGMLLGLAFKVLADRGEAEEIVQEVFLQLWRQAGRYDATRSSISTWLALITRSRAIDRLRSRRVKERTVAAVSQEKPQRHTSPEGMEDVLVHERRQRLISELSELPGEQRQVLELAFFQGMTQSEIAKRTETPLGTVKTRSLLAMRKLRKALESDIEDLL